MDNLLKYVLEGLAVGAVAYLIKKGKMTSAAFVQLAALAAASFAVLDYLAPGVAYGARLGTGFGFGMRQVGGSSLMKQVGGAKQVGGSSSMGVNPQPLVYDANYRPGPSPQQINGNGLKTTEYIKPTSFARGSALAQDSALDLKPEIIREMNLLPVPDNTGACEMPPYQTTADRAEQYAEVLKNDNKIFVEPVTKTPVGQCFRRPYRLIPGQWAEQDLMAGYNENVTAVNA